MADIEKYSELKQQIIDIGRLGYDRGLMVGTGGNISCRCEEGMLITRSGGSLGNTKPEDILLVDHQGQLLTTDTDFRPSVFRPSIETRFHLAIYQTRPDVNCVYHTHSTYCSYWALRDQELPLVSSVSRLLLGRMPLAAYAEPGTEELVKNILLALEEEPQAKGLLLAGHGAVALHTSVEQAFYIAELMEQTAQLAYLLEQKKD